MSKETVAATEKVETKERSKTDVYKEHLQAIIFQTTGNKVSKDKAWELFKNITHGTLQHVLNLPDKRLSLAGVGSFEILEAKPRGERAGLDKDGNTIKGAEVWACSPKYRFYPSASIEAVVEAAYGHGTVETKNYGIYNKVDEVKEEKAEAKADKKAVKAGKKAEAKADPFDAL